MEKIYVVWGTLIYSPENKVLGFFSTSKNASDYKKKVLAKYLEQYGRPMTDHSVYITEELLDDATIS